MAQSNLWRAVVAVVFLTAVVTDLRVRGPRLIEAEGRPPQEGVTVKRQSNPVLCRKYREAFPRYWDAERGEYLPVNWEWRECMGVGRK